MRWITLCFALAVAVIDYGQWGWWDQDPLPEPLEHCRYDRQRADEVMAVARQFRVVDGPAQGQPFDPAAVRWQEQVIRPLFGVIRKDDGLRQFRRVYALVPKKGGKSPFAAFLGLNAILFDYWVDPATGWRQYNNNVRAFLVATSVQQSLNVFTPGKGMLAENPDTRTLINRGPSAIRPGQIKISDSHNTHVITYWPESAPIENAIQIISSSPKHHEGKGIDLLVLDELHLMSRKLREIFKGSQDSKIQPIEISITTAGEPDEHPDNIWLEEHELAMEVLQDPTVNPRLLPVVYMPTADDEEAIKDRDVDECMEIARRVNPGLGVTILEDAFEQEMRDASRSAWAWINFCRRRFNLITTGIVESYIPVAKWDLCAGAWAEYAEFEQALKGRACYLGLDLSSKTDLTSMALVFPPLRAQEAVSVLSYSFLPAVDVEKKSKQDGADYAEWVERGWLHHNPDLNEVDYEAVWKKVVWACRTYKVQGMGGDGWGAATQIAQQAKKKFGIETESVPTTFTHMSEPMKTLEAKVLDGKIEHAGNPVLRYAVSRLVGKVGLNEEVRPVKAKAKGRVDPAVAMLNGFNRVLFSKHRKRVSIAG